MDIEMFSHQLEFLGSEATHTAIVGGFGCFLKGQNIILDNGNLKPINEIKVKDFVKSFNLESGKVENKKVLNTFEYEAESYFNIKLKNGLDVKVTKDHKFLYENKWQTIENILKKRLYLHIGIQEVDIKKNNLKLNEYPPESGKV